MNEIFKNIDEEKRDRIINSAFEEFSKNGFEKASTNVIVKNAGISKGSLFHYFENKQELYEKLEEFMMVTATDAVKNNVDWSESDFFERMKQIIIAKGEITNQYPYIYDFAYMIMDAKSIDEVRAQAKKVSPDLEKKVYTYNIDFSKFKEGLDMEKVMNIIQWTFEKFGEELWNKMKLTKEPINFEESSAKADDYIRIFKDMFYKESIVED